eukprot:CAMPEP_0113529824 /NCGR_PEP_ID=MMETSP0015_2-20120614/2601_1 /TAXON_ID=2838 /ORGANISM="Odontella" /LENGTH=883 /DNA_ID=CAMNT_0000428483 /DNA_START=425 /DNA_END=3075 /DNA_ORIENTATION=- /assembly_acc=CAM_ASM_000160
MQRRRESRLRATLLHESYRCDAAAAGAAISAKTLEGKAGSVQAFEYGRLSTIESAKSYDSIPDSSSALEEEGHSTAVASHSHLAVLKSIPSIAVVAILNLLISVPFGSAYFSPDVPLGGVERQVLGMRLCLLSMTVAQAMVGLSGLSTLDPLVLIQLASMTPFYHHFALLARKAAAGANENDDAESYILPTTLFLMSSLTVLAGISHFAVGKLGLAKAASFFPRYVMLGLVGGCGVFFVLLSISVSVGPHLAPDANLTAAPRAWSCQFLVTAAFVAGIRVLRVLIPKEKFMLLDPVYFLSVPVVFYAGMFALGTSFDGAVELGYFFKDAQVSESTDPNLPSMNIGWGSIDFGKIQWETTVWAMPNVLSLIILSIMLTVPFPPLISLYLGTEDTFDINTEFVSNGYANIIIGFLFPGGLFMCESYSNTVLFKNAGAGGGKICSALLSLSTFVFFMYGPKIVDRIPRCMAGTLMLDMGLNLFLDAVKVDKHSPFEYASIWIILCVMTASSMTTGLIAGLILALFNYTQQSFVDEDPIRRVVDMDGLPSTCLRSHDALQALNDPVYGRKTVVLFQLQGHLFYGNFPKLKEEVLEFLNKRKENGESVSMAIIDLDFVVGIDSSAASLIEKMMGTLKITMGISSVFVSSSYFANSTRNLFQVKKTKLATSILQETSEIHGEYYKTINDALIACEDTIIGHHRVGLEKKYADNVSFASLDAEESDFDLERSAVLHVLRAYIGRHTLPSAQHIVAGQDDGLTEAVFRSLKRDVYSRGDTLWNCDDNPISAKLLIKGSFVAKSKRELDYTGTINVGTIVGLRAFLLCEKHRVSLCCEEDGSIAYSLDIPSYDSLCRENPRAGRALDLALARNLSLRLRAVTNTSGVALMGA